MKFTKKTIYIGLFSVLYLIVAFSSFFHACAFFGLANNSWMSIILAFAFEVGQAAVLFSLLTSTKDRSRIMPWVLMFMFTLVQVIGNVYSSYKYIVTNSIENLRYFKEPIFIWTNLPDDQATVIIVYVVGAILPVAALLLTSMITNYLTDEEERKNELEQKKIENNSAIKETIDEENKVDKLDLEETNINNEKTEDIKQQAIDENEQQENKSDNDVGQFEQPLDTTESKASAEDNDQKIDYEEDNSEVIYDPDEIDRKKVENIIGKPFEENEETNEKRQSHFINL